MKFQEFANMPDELKTPGICFAAVKACGEALKYVPESMKTPEICVAAVQARRTMDILSQEEIDAMLITVGTSPKFKARERVSPLKFVPENLKTLVICLTAIREDASAFEFVPENMKTSKMYLEAIKLNSYAFKYVPEELKTPEWCATAWHYNSSIFHSLPEDLKQAVKEIINKR